MSPSTITHLDQHMLDAYMDEDSIAELIKQISKPRDHELTCQRWLMNSSAKRLGFSMLYGDLLSTSGKRILDIGGGLTCLTNKLASQHDYHLVDLMAHDSPEHVEELRGSPPSFRVDQQDWYEVPLDQEYDVIVANDIFPNVDQRLALFLNKAIPACSQLRVSLTYHNAPRFHFAKRLDADEVFCMLAWNGPQVAAVLSEYQTRFANWQPNGFEQDRESLYPNGRQVCIATLNGDI
ncbi:hypothetical protein GTQ45_01475 [Pyruvatibacter mobilis]|uniref:Methyltransferase domain-containing protein n=1 Tax=Pyruvatibacter mobilis TaxID=1712261 RepID=A0A845Q7P8_9HYPH|nr:class I SAM-dependent methyltransferase [Pyruvatibacter mobilis]NBG94399.1 hypothetical protein [Pyruvatibacter mobilis]QJD73926.1 class I SAM-dependent methyltransferase [Pyruvatibacter mobilis]QJD76687.1 class I SAM-dependent methyltransferase [Pyruvatibacter mobilis]GGD02665.1 hypothetical protein GCM10011587_02940 [Pyruvatibacter mobilis]